MNFRLKIIIVNSITLSRVFLVYPFIVYFNTQYSFYILLWMGFSDFLDGFLARRFRIQSSFGGNLDLYADKFVSLILGLFLASKGEIHSYFLVFLFVRDFTITIFRAFELSDSIPNNIGKYKTVFIYSYFTIILFHSNFKVTFVDFDVFAISMEYFIMFLSFLSFLYSIPQLRIFLNYIIGTGFYSSLIFKIAPGTFTSIFALGILFSISHLHIYSKFTLLLSLFILHFSFFNDFLKFNNHTTRDPRSYTLDEFIGIAIIWPFMEGLTIREYLIFFVFFRFFDILKPLGIKQVQNLNNISSSLTNVLDDIIAAVYSYLFLLMIK